MSTAFDVRWNALEARRDKMASRIAAMPGHVQQHGTPKMFSPAEVLEHMALSEEYYIKLIQDTKPAQLAGKKAKGNFLFRFVVRMLAKARQVPTIQEMSPQSKCSVELGRKHWAAVRERLRPLLANVPAGKPVLKHPMFGYLGIAEVLEIMEAHAAYHELRLPVL